MMPNSLQICPLVAEDRDVLATATLSNLNWCGERFSRGQILETPKLHQYTEFYPERGDFGFVALDGESVVGVVWAQFLPEPGGYGFVDSETPEMSVWVESGLRGSGFGRALIAQLLDSARHSGINQLSLSVESENRRAIGLYRSFGFSAVEGREPDGLMVWVADQHHYDLV